MLKRLSLATFLVLGATSFASAQCLVESFQGSGAPHGRLVSADSSFVYVTNNVGNSLECFTLGANGHSSLSTTALMATAQSLDSLGDTAVISVDIGGSYETALVDANTGLKTSLVFSADAPEVAITENASGTWIAIGFATAGLGGEVHLYQRLPGASLFQFALTLEQPGGVVAGSRFGEGLDLCGDTLAISAPGDDSAGVDTGALYGYRWNGTTWVQNTNWFGGFAGGEAYANVAVTLDTIMTGTPTFDGNNGLVDFFQWNGSFFDFDSNWIVTDSPGSRFGESVAIDGDNAIAGSNGLYATSFQFDGTTWAPFDAVEVPPAGNATRDVTIDSSASSAASGTRIYVGAPTYDSGTGAVHVYTFSTSSVTDLGNGLAGFFGLTPRLNAIGDVCAFGGRLDIALSAMRPGSFAYIFVGLSEGAVPFKGGTFVPSTLIFQLGGLPTGSGTLQLGADLPYGLDGLSFVMQAWIEDSSGPNGASATNGLKIDFGG